MRLYQNEKHSVGCDPPSPVWKSSRRIWIGIWIPSRRAMARLSWSSVARRGTCIATPSSRRRVDGVEDDAAIQHERAGVVSPRTGPTVHPGASRGFDDPDAPRRARRPCRSTWRGAFVVPPQLALDGAAACVVLAHIMFCRRSLR